MTAPPHPPEPRPRLAYFSPLPPLRSGISDYSRQLLPHLAQFAELTLYVDDPTAVDAALRQQFEVRAMAQYPAERWQYDLPIYQMGNNDLYHGGLYALLLRYPGLVVLHDYSLHGFIIDLTKGQRLYRPKYDREIGYAWGSEGMRASRLHWAGGGGAMGRRPLNERLLDSSLGVIVHSRYARDRIAAQRRSLPTTIIPHLRLSAAAYDHAETRSRRAKLAWPDDALIFASLGQITPTKQIDLTLRAFKAVHQSFPQARYLLAGENKLGSELDMQIEELGLTAVVHQTGHVDRLSDFTAWIQTADIIVNLRNPTVGETSGTALRAMGTGRPLIVYDHGWYSEIPDAACVKIPPDDKDALLAAMKELAKSAMIRKEMGKAGAAYVEEECHPARIAEQYAAFINQLLTRYREQM